MNEEYLIGMFKKGLAAQLDTLKESLGRAVVTGDALWAGDIILSIQKVEARLRDDAQLRLMAKSVLVEVKRLEAK